MGKAGNRQSAIGNFTILVRPEKCTGCRLCESVCSVARTGRSDPTRAAIRVIYSKPDYLYFPLLCSQCSEAACVRVCPGDALSREREYGPVTIDPGRCSSCGSCLLSCPLKVIHSNERSGIAEPCNLCNGDPECVKSCYAGALQLVEINEDSLEAKQESSRRLAAIIGRSDGSLLTVVTRESEEV